MEFINFLTDCFNEVNEKHKVFFEKYNINSYSNWFYDQASGILTFSDENKELNFRYYDVGTYSKNTKTWKWSWDNEHSLKKVKDKVEQVKEFGVKNNYDKLTIGTFESHEDEGWEFASITCKLLNGFGMYRPQFDHLLSFMVVYEIVDNEQAALEKEKYIDCDKHERRRRAFVCQHLDTNTKKGFEEYFETFEDMEFEYEDDDFQAWCNECEKVRLKSNGWNEESEKYADIKLICEKCYFEMKKVNS